MMRTLLAAAALFASAAYADCPAPPPAQRDIIADSYYDDPPVYSHVDPVKHAAYEAAVGPLEDYLRAVAKTASAGDKQCTLKWLVAWAENDAMLGKIEKEQAHYERKWMLAGLALSYAKVRDGASADQRASIDSWLQALAFHVREHSDAYKGTKNNHYYWEGLAVGAVGVVTHHDKDVEWSRGVLKAAEADIADDGTLPLEMTRGGRALHYHLFSIAPLAMLESILDVQSDKIAKLAAFCDKAWREPTIAAKLAGTPQIGILDDDHDWAPIFARHHGAPLTPTPNRKAYVIRLGGDLEQANPIEHVKK
jgi:poly(beta-D-mannuronate) lyase